MGCDVSGAHSLATYAAPDGGVYITYYTGAFFWQEGAEGQRRHPASAATIQRLDLSDVHVAKVSTNGTIVADWTLANGLPKVDAANGRAFLQVQPSNEGADDDDNDDDDDHPTTGPLIAYELHVSGLKELWRVQEDSVQLLVVAHGNPFVIKNGRMVGYDGATGKVIYGPVSTPIPPHDGLYDIFGICRKPLPLTYKYLVC